MTAAQKIPLAHTLTQFTARRINDAFQREGQALPCSVVSVSGAIVTVKFEINSKFTLPNVTVPMYGAEYIRYPIQPGCKGCVFPADARLAGMSGIGGGVADLSQPGNLTALVFAPISNVSWAAVDPNALVLYGPNGVVLRDTGNASNITLTPSGIAMTADELTTNTTGNTDMTAAAFALHGPVTIHGTLHVVDAVTLDSTMAVTGAVTADSTIIATGDVIGASISLSTHTHEVISVGVPTSPPLP